MIKDELKTGGNRSFLLQQHAMKTINRPCKQRKCLIENENIKNTYTQKSAEIIWTNTEKGRLEKFESHRIYKSKQRQGLALGHLPDELE